jgi:hypothetical protein
VHFPGLTLDSKEIESSVSNLANPEDTHFTFILDDKGSLILDLDKNCGS